MEIAMNNSEVELKLNKIFIDKFNINFLDNRSGIEKQDDLLGYKFKFHPRDLIYLLYYIEEEFNITITEQDITSIKFNTLDTILFIINKKLEEK